MERKIKIGDKVLLTKPKENNGDIQVDPLIVWRPDVGAYIGKIFTVKSIDLDDNTYLCEYGDVNFWARESWLTKIEMNPNEQEPQQCCEKRGIEPARFIKHSIAKPYCVTQNLFSKNLKALFLILHSIKTLIAFGYFSFISFQFILLS